jgi:hypothetical protein
MSVLTGLDVSKPKENKPKTALPQVSEFVAQQLAEWIQSHEQMQRLPTGTAKVLILATLLHRKRQPWPTRQEVADHLGVSRPLVDMVVSQRSATGHIEVLIKTKQGFVARRPSVIRERYVVPSGGVTRVVEEAEREEKNMRRRMQRASVTQAAVILAVATAVRCDVLEWLFHIPCPFKIY